LRRKRKRRLENNIKMNHRELDCEIKTESYWLVKVKKGKVVPVLN
jgi:hypothetical protein